MPFCHLFQLFLLRADSRWICKSILHLLQLNLIFDLYFLFHILTIFSKFLCPIHFLFLFYASLKNEIYLHFYFVSPSSLFVIFIQLISYHTNNWTSIYLYTHVVPTGPYGRWLADADTESAGPQALLACGHCGPWRLALWDCRASSRISQGHAIWQAHRALRACRPTGPAVTGPTINGSLQPARPCKPWGLALRDCRALPACKMLCSPAEPASMACRARRDMQACRAR